MVEENVRIVEILRAGIWYHEDFEDIQKGDIFRLFEFDGSLVLSLNNCVEFEAISDAYINENNVWEVKSIEVDYDYPKEIGIYEYMGGN